MNESTVLTPQHKIESLWAATQAKQKWSKETIKDLKNLPNLKEELAVNFKSHRLQEDDLTLYNWFIGTAFGVCVNDLKRL